MHLIIRSPCSLEIFISTYAGGKDRDCIRSSCESLQQLAVEYSSEVQFFYFKQGWCGDNLFLFASRSPIPVSGSLPVHLIAVLFGREPVEVIHGE